MPSAPGPRTQSIMRPPTPSATASPMQAITQSRTACPTRPTTRSISRPTTQCKSNAQGKQYAAAGRRAGGLLLRADPVGYGRSEKRPGRSDARSGSVHSVGAVARRAHFSPDLPRSVVRPNERPPAYLFRRARLSRAARGPHVHELARVAAPDLRLGAIGNHDGPVGRLVRLRQRVDVVGAAQHRVLQHRAAFARVRDVSGVRAHVLADEP